MDFAPVYLIWRFLYRIKDFFHHWYVDGSRFWGHKFLGTLGRLDQTFAIKITFIHFFEPLYRDYTAIGRILGVIFRTGRILIAAVVYAACAIIFLALYLIWLALPVTTLLYAARNI